MLVEHLIHIASQGDEPSPVARREVAKVEKAPPGSCLIPIRNRPWLALEQIE